MRILFAASGTRGDVQPLLALALALRERGHECLIATSPNFAPEVGSFGLGFSPVGKDSQELFQGLGERIGHRGWRPRGR